MKIIRKGTIVLSLLFIMLTSIPIVNAWLTVNHATNITIVQVDEPYYLDLLIQKPEAPLLSAEQIAELLPAEYAASPFVEALNGVRDADGFVSLRLYPEMYTTITMNNNHTFSIKTNHARPLSFKIILVFEDGSTNVSPILTQRHFNAEITYDLETVGMQDYTQTVIYEHPPLQGEGYQPFWDFGPASIVIYGIVIVLLFELILLFLFGYRKGKSFLIVGSMNAIALIGGFSIFLFHETIPITILLIFFVIALSVWTLGAALWLPKRLSEKPMSRTMVYAIVANIISVYAVLLIHYLY